MAGCGCPSLGGVGHGVGYLGAANPCDQSGAWVIVKGNDGKCYNLCVFTGERIELDAASCAGSDVLDVPAG